VNARAAAVAGALIGLLTAGCSSTPTAPTPDPATQTPTTVPPYDGRLPPARAVLALVPAAATTVLVTDFSVIRRQLGLPELTSEATAADRSAFWLRAGRAAPLLTGGLLRPVDARLRGSFGFGQDDVAWEARFRGGGVHGWVLSLRDGVDMARVAEAARQGVGVLAGARVRKADLLVTSGVARGDQPVLAQDPVWPGLLVGRGEATYLRRGCLPHAGATPETLDPLAAFSLTFGDHVATVRTDRDRDDLFDRLDLARREPVGGTTFGRVFRHGVGDPSTGRIGYDVPDPTAAAALTRADDLPVGVCPAGAAE
jgi:hypothetical protein